MTFPQYRRYSDGKSFFRIDSPGTLVELKLMGSYYQLHRMEARILPDRNYISDLIELGFPGVEIIEENDFEETLAMAQSSKTLLA